MICSALLETDNGFAVRGFLENALSDIDLDPSIFEGFDDRDADKLELIFVMVRAKSG